MRNTRGLHQRGSPGNRGEAKNDAAARPAFVVTAVMAVTTRRNGQYHSVRGGFGMPPNPPL